MKLFGDYCDGIVRGLGELKKSKWNIFCIIRLKWSSEFISLLIVNVTLISAGLNIVELIAAH